MRKLILQCRPTAVTEFVSLQTWTISVWHITNINGYQLPLPASIGVVKDIYSVDLLGLFTETKSDLIFLLHYLNIKIVVYQKVWFRVIKFSCKLLFYNFKLNTRYFPSYRCPSEFSVGELATLYWNRKETIKPA